MYKTIFKPLFDIFGALVLLPFVLLELIIIGPIIFFTDRGPIFYNATRCGYLAKPFKMFKLRSMYVNAPDLRNNDGSTFNSDNDPRVTPIGRILRKTSLDEFPQLLNVLIGDMSFIGPRPTLYTGKGLEKYEDSVKMRYMVKPGITGYSQAYFRNSISQKEKFEYDAYYVKHLSLFLDIKVLFMTCWSVISHKNINTYNK